MFFKPKVKVQNNMRCDQYSYEWVAVIIEIQKFYDSI